MPQNPENPESVRYADALIALGDACGDLPRIERDLTALMDLMESAEDLRRFISDRTVLDQGKELALWELLRDRVHPALLHFVLVLATRNQLRNLREIGRAFLERHSARGQKAMGVLQSPVPVGEDTLAAIEKEAGRLLGKELRLRQKIDPALLGGLRIQVGDFVVDGTIEAQLDRIRKNLLA